MQPDWKKNKDRGYELMPAKEAAVPERKLRISGCITFNKPKAPVVSKVLRANNEFWSHEARWEKGVTGWKCVSGDGVLQRLVGMNPAQAKMELIRLGANWEWTVTAQEQPSGTPRSS